MCDNPFGLPTNPYGWGEEDEELQEIRRMKKACDDKEEEDLYIALHEQGYEGDTPTEEASLSDHSSQGGGRRKQSKRQADLVKQVNSQANLLINELGWVHIYQEGGYYQHIPNFDAYLVNLLPEETLAELNVREIPEIVERLSWVRSNRCNLDGFNYREESNGMKSRG